MEADRPTPRSTKTRRRGWTPNRQQRFVELIERYGVDAHTDRFIDVLDVGVGHGETTVGSALQAPDRFHLAVELHVPGVGRLLDALAHHDLRNVGVMVADAVQVLDELDSGQVGEIRVLFPDPWPKVRHHVRRLVRRDVVDRFARVLGSGGIVHLTTDHAEYAHWMQRVMASSTRFIGGPVDRPQWRVDSRYSRRAEAAGRAVIDQRYGLSGEVPKA